MDANDHAHQEPDEGQRFVDPSSKGDAQKPSGGEASPETVSSSVFSASEPNLDEVPEPIDDWGFPGVPRDVPKASSPVTALARGLRDLQEGLAESVDFAGLHLFDDPDLIAALIGVERISCLLESLQVALAAQVQERSTLRVKAETISSMHGCANAGELIQRATLCTRAEANKRIRLGEKTSEERAFSGAPLQEERPYVALALRSGALPVPTAHRIVTTLSRAPKAEAEKLDYAERSLVEAATGIDFETGTLADIQRRIENIPEPKVLDDHADAGLLDPLPNPEDALPDSRPGLAQHGDTIATMCKAWQQYLDQDGTPPTDKEVLEARGIRIGAERNGVIPINGRLTPEVAALFSNLCDAINAPRNNNASNADSASNDTSDTSGTNGNSHSFGGDSDTGRSSDTGGNSGAIEESDEQKDRLEWLLERSGYSHTLVGDMEGRSPDQKRHDALAAILGVAASSTEVPNHGGSPVTVLVQTTEEALNGDGAAWLHGPAFQTNLLNPQAARHATCSGALQYYAKNKAGKIVALGSKQRVFTTNQRRAIVARDGGCVIPGCNTPPAWLEIHHVLPHAQGGKTHIDNGVAMCWFHHRSIETSGWEVRMENGVPQVRTPIWLDPDRNWLTVRPPTRPPTYKSLNERHLHFEEAHLDQAEKPKGSEEPKGPEAPDPKPPDPERPGPKSEPSKPDAPKRDENGPPNVTQT